MANKGPITGIWASFDAYIISYHDEDISGFILRYGVQTRQGMH